MKKFIIILLLFSSCASSKPSWDRVNPDTLFEAINVKDLERRNKDKNIETTFKTINENFDNYKDFQNYYLSNISELIQYFNKNNIDLFCQHR